FDLDESLGIHERLDFDDGHGAVVAAHMLAVHFAERREVREIRGAVGDVHDHTADILGLPARRAHHFNHAAKRAVPLRHEIADGNDLAGDEQNAAALLAQHAVIPPA